jgi:hypothetical protein
MLLCSLAGAKLSQANPQAHVLRNGRSRIRTTQMSMISPKDNPHTLAIVTIFDRPIFDGAPLIHRNITKIEAKLSITIRVAKATIRASCLLSIAVAQTGDEYHPRVRQDYLKEENVAFRGQYAVVFHESKANCGDLGCR